MYTVFPEQGALQFFLEIGTGILIQVGIECSLILTSSHLASLLQTVTGAVYSVSSWSSAKLCLLTTASGFTDAGQKTIHNFSKPA